MSDDDTQPHLIHAWLAARSVVRGLPAPVPDRGGSRVEVHSEKEVRRWVFSQVCDGLRELGEEVSAPLNFIKVCGTADDLRNALPSKWQEISTGYLMTAGAEKKPMRQLPDGYTLQTQLDGPVIAVRIIAPDGSLAASGFAAESAGVFVYDQIVTAPEHGRRGLGNIVMHTLAAHRKSSAATEVLVATDDGRALYISLGWRVLSPFSTAAISG
jgi:hypothetical protein